MATRESGSQFDLAILGADDPLGGAILGLLDSREMPVGRLHALTLGEAETSVSFQGQDWPCESAEQFDFGQAQALVVASRRPAAQRLVEQVRARHPHMPILLVDQVDPAPVQAVTPILRALTALGGAATGDAWVALPAAYGGQDGVEELASQARALFQMESPDAEVFPIQMAFNLQPYGGPAEESQQENRLAEALAHRVPDAEVGFSQIWAPLFFGAAIVLHVRTTRPVTVEAVRASLAHREEVVLMEAELPAATPTPATDAQASDAVFVSRIRHDGRRLRFWLVCDPIQLEAARMVEIVENWIDKPVDSMLT